MITEQESAQQLQEWHDWIEPYLRRFLAASHGGVARTMDEWAVLFYQWLDTELKQEHDASCRGAAQETHTL